MANMRVLYISEDVYDRLVMLHLMRRINERIEFTHRAGSIRSSIHWLEVLEWFLRWW